MTKLGGQTCSECGSRMIPTFKGLKCPKMAACGRGGIEEKAGGTEKAEATTAEGGGAKGKP